MLFGGGGEDPTTAAIAQLGQQINTGFQNVQNRLNSLEQNITNELKETRNLIVNSTSTIISTLATEINQSSQFVVDSILQAQNDAIALNNRIRGELYNQAIKQLSGTLQLVVDTVNGYEKRGTAIAQKPITQEFTTAVFAKSFTDFPLEPMLPTEVKSSMLVRTTVTNTVNTNTTNYVESQGGRDSIQYQRVVTDGDRIRGVQSTATIAISNFGTEPPLNQTQANLNITENEKRKLRNQLLITNLPTSSIDATYNYFLEQLSSGSNTVFLNNSKYEWIETSNNESIRPAIDVTNRIFPTHTKEITFVRYPLTDSVKSLYDKLIVKISVSYKPKNGEIEVTRQITMQAKSVITLVPELTEPLLDTIKSQINAVDFKGGGTFAQSIIRNNLAECMRKLEIRIQNIHIQEYKNSIVANLQNTVLQSTGNAQTLIDNFNANLLTLADDSGTVTQLKSYFTNFKTAFDKDCARNFKDVMIAGASATVKDFIDKGGFSEIDVTPDKQYLSAFRQQCTAYIVSDLANQITDLNFSPVPNFEQFVQTFKRNVLDYILNATKTKLLVELEPTISEFKTINFNFGNNLESSIRTLIDSQIASFKLLSNPDITVFIGELQAAITGRIVKAKNEFFILQTQIKEAESSQANQVKEVLNDPLKAIQEAIDRLSNTPNDISKVNTASVGKWLLIGTAGVAVGSMVFGKPTVKSK
jgi:hypothetical protein